MSSSAAPILSFANTLSRGLVLWLCSLFVVGCSTAACERATVCSATSADAGIESCNGVDDDLDGHIDESDRNVGAPCGTEVGVCTIGVLACTDGVLACDSENGVNETCNAVDDDCDGWVDESLTTTFYLDADLDGYGSGEHVCEACDAGACAGAGPWVTLDGDCDDACDACFAGAPEVCDMRDNDCDGAVDEGAQRRVFEDADHDGFGAGEAVHICLDEGGLPPAGYALRDGDCADEDSRANPDATLRFTTPIRGVTDASIDFDFDCNGREERLHEPCASCRGGACWLGLGEPFRASDPPCGTLGRAQRSDLLEPPGRPSLCVRGESYEDRIVACR
ncbi:MAG: MopE-related protein [Polyangiales bacterium]